MYVYLLVPPILTSNLICKICCIITSSLSNHSFWSGSRAENLDK